MPSSGSDAFDAALAAATEHLLERVHALGASPTRIVIDGRSGSGKTTLAARLAALWPARVVALDEFYPGWDGLAEATRIVADDILAPLAAGRDGAYSRWDWEAGRSAERLAVDPDTPLVIEGAGALSAGARSVADLAVWVDAPATVRRERAIARDGAAYAPHWERWAAQERAHIARNRPADIADAVFELP